MTFERERGRTQHLEIPPSEIDNDIIHKRSRSPGTPCGIPRGRDATKTPFSRQGNRPPSTGMARRAEAAAGSRPVPPAARTLVGQGDRGEGQHLSERGC